MPGLMNGHRGTIDGVLKTMGLWCLEVLLHKRRVVDLLYNTFPVTHHQRTHHVHQPARPRLSPEWDTKPSLHLHHKHMVWACPMSRIAYCLVSRSLWVVIRPFKDQVSLAGRSGEKPSGGPQGGKSGLC